MTSGPKSKFLLQIGIICAVLALAVGRAQAETTSGDAQAAVVTSLSFVQYDDLNFGRVITGVAAGTVTISPENVRTATGGAVPVGNDFQVARFAGKGSQGQRVRIQTAPSTVTLTGPGPSMTVTNLTIGTDSTLRQNGASANYRIQPTDGVFLFTVGGRLNVGANQPGGSYSGTFTVTLDYP